MHILKVNCIKIDHCKYGNLLADYVKGFLEKIVILAKRTDTVLELNESSLVTNEAGVYDRVSCFGLH